MKNVHILSTENESRLRYNSFNKVYELCEFPRYHTDIKSTHNVYITSDEEIKEGDWVFDLDIKRIVKADNLKVATSKKSQCWYYKKIILTTDQDLIRDGVQAIDDEFLEWFVKNPSCESVEIERDSREVGGHNGGVAIEYGLYEIIIPEEEPKQDLEREMFELEQELDIPSHLRWHNSKPKQETLEEASEKYSINQFPLKDFNGKQWNNHRELCKIDFINGAKWQQERMYSEDDLRRAFLNWQEYIDCDENLGWSSKLTEQEWFEQFKNK